jgi:hypothetical protein
MPTKKSDLGQLSERVDALSAQIDLIRDQLAELEGALDHLGNACEDIGILEIELCRTLGIAPELGWKLPHNLRSAIEVLHVEIHHAYDQVAAVGDAS